MALTVQAVYRLALRQAKGLIRSVFALLGLALPVPNHTTLSRRGRTLRRDFLVNAGRGLDLAIDSTGLRSRSIEAQRTEASIAVATLNRMTELGMPRAVRVA